MTSILSSSSPAQLRQSFKKVPGVQWAANTARRIAGRIASRGKTRDQIFGEIIATNRWKGEVSHSGTGSDRLQTAAIMRELPLLCAELQIGTMLDIPCGDFYWMREVDLEGVDYTGADIVDRLIEANRRFETEARRFRCMDLCRDALPRVDLVFCRDCLVHLSYADAWKALANICASGSKYLLTTTFTGPRKNHDIATGHWRTLNLEKRPFLLPPPERIIEEQCTEVDGYFADKALGLWSVDAVGSRVEEQQKRGRASDSALDRRN